MGTVTKKLNKQPETEPELAFSGEDLALIYEALHELPAKKSRELIQRFDKFKYDRERFIEKQNGENK